MSYNYNNYLIAAALDLGLIPEFSAEHERISYGITDDLSWITIDNGTNFYEVNDNIIARAKYMCKRHEVRVYRQGLLKDCDWVVLEDVDLSETEKQKWLDYRQALRDSPNTVIEGDEENFSWPQKPNVNY